MSRAGQIIQKLNEFISEPLSSDTMKKVGIGMAGGLAAAPLIKRAVKRKAKKMVSG